jgi:hypothetical protein
MKNETLDVVSIKENKSVASMYIYDGIICPNVESTLLFSNTAQCFFLVIT